MHTTTKITRAALAGLLAVLAGCADTASGAGPGGDGTAGSGTSSSTVEVTTSAPQSEPVGVDELAGRTYLSTAVTGRTLVAGTTIALRFDGRELTANAGCNTMLGSYLAGGGRLTVGGLGSTELGCPSAPSAQDSWLAAFLEADPRWVLDGERLTLTTGSTTVVLTDRRVADPDRPAEGTTWQLTGLIDGESASSVPADSPVVRLRLAYGELKLWNDCVVAIGRYTIDGNTLDATVPDPTGETGCATQVLDVAVGVFGEGTTVNMEADQLRLLAPDGRGLMFTEAAGVQAPVPPGGGIGTMGEYPPGGTVERETARRTT